jgi:hypothetical protein
VRYSGSIERMDLGEQNDDKSVVLVEFGPEGLRGVPLLLPLEATPTYRIEFGSPNEPELARGEEHPDATNDRSDRVHHAAGVDNLRRPSPRWRRFSRGTTTAPGPRRALWGRR